ncbi:MAG: tRNA (adenosine(37)-N6)-threonylcarbamoyltransferase complex transferase subunit TsaD [Cytophagales bacterium]|jgi:N6-L-threonylcarbamoyladenine synthase
MFKNKVFIIAIESSCDETSVSVISDGVIISNVIVTQFLHKNYGGVIPEIASMNHQKNMIFIIKKAISDANIDIFKLSAIGFTQGPGLLGSLLIGVSFAKALSFSLKLPLISIDHIKAHVLSNFIDYPKPTFPFLCLIVSGGHTKLVLVEDYLNFKTIGETRDDAIGESFDKIANLINIPYPGGSIVDLYSNNGFLKFLFPISNLSNLNFSFSGIKTSFLYFLKYNKIKDKNFIKTNRSNICFSIQYHLISILVKKLKYSIFKTNIFNISLSGGVAANSNLRSELFNISIKNNWNFFIPDFKYCTDNAAMIAISSYYQYLVDDFSDLNAKVIPKLFFN